VESHPHSGRLGTHRGRPRGDGAGRRHGGSVGCRERRLGGRLREEAVLDCEQATWGRSSGRHR
jgi:hypothetical protein